MRVSRFLGAYAVYLFAYGLPSLLIPGPLLAGAYASLAPDPAHELLTRYWGAVSIGLGLFMWRLRRQDDLSVTKSTILAVIFVESLNVILTVIGITNQIVGAALGSASAVVHLAFALGAAYFLFRTESAQA